MNVAAFAKVTVLLLAGVKFAIVNIS